MNIEKNMAFVKGNVTILQLGALLGILLTCLSCSPKSASLYVGEITQHREHYKSEFAADERAPLRTKEELNLLDFYPPDMDYKCDCSVEINPAKEVITMSTYSGKEKDFLLYGTALCSIKGQLVSLGLYRSLQNIAHPIYGKLLFVPFKDLTNDETTYGGGRYMDIPISNINNGRLVIDFNKCYNPWCAYSSGYNCPVPPPNNHLDIEIEAGEKKYKGAYKD